MLGGLKGRTVVARTENGAETTAALDANIPVAKLAAPKNIVTKDEADLQGDQWVGRRTPIAPVLSARSDSFLLRAYGKAVVGGVTVRAWR